MEIRIEKPPIWEEAHKHFQIDDRETVYTYDGVLYNPAGIHVDEHLMAHEEKHAKQQAATEGGSAEWWKTYFASAEFRQDQELKAYQSQYAHFCKEIKQRERRFRYRFELARFLASKMYNAGISFDDAMNKIQGSTV